MGLGLITAGLLFLFNPNVNILDIFPDFIGALLIYFGLVKMSRINIDLKQAKKNFGIFFWIELAKFASIALISSQDSTRYLLLSFIFGAVECIVFTFAALSLFNGIECIGRKADSEVVFTSKTKGNRSYDMSTTAKKTMITFFFVRTACSILPEFTEIAPDQIYYGNRLVDIALTKFKPAFHIILIAVVLIFSIFYLTRTIGYFLKLSGDKKLKVFVKSEHEAFLNENPSFFLRRRSIIGLLFYAAAILLSANPSGDGLPWIPLAYIAPLLIASALILCKHQTLTLIAIIPAAVLIPISIHGTSLKAAFYFDSTKFTDIFYFEKSMEKFTVISNLSLLQYLLFGAALIIITLALLKNRDLFLKAVVNGKDISDDKLEYLADTYDLLAVRLKQISIGTTIFYCVMTKLTILLGALSIEYDLARILSQVLSIASVIIAILWFATVLKFMRFIRGK